MSKNPFLIFLLLLCCSFSLSLMAQNEENPIALLDAAVDLMENKQFDQAIELLQKAQNLAPNEIIFHYEIALAQTWKSDHNSAIKSLKKLRKHPDCFDQVYQLLGVNFSYSNQAKKAIKCFDNGLKRFPHSGILYLERGNMENMKDNFDQAIVFYELGIKNAPDFASNYYRAAQLFLNSSEKLWGMIYGEIFMNLEIGTDRSSQMSDWLYQTYKQQIIFESDTSVKVNFTKNNVISLEQVVSGNFKMPFGSSVYEPNILIALQDVNNINLFTINRIRSIFVKNYFANFHHLKYPNVLFDYQKRISEAGHMDAYNYWILNKGNPVEFDVWMQTNSQKWDDFVSWYGNNRMLLNEENRFYRLQY